MPADMTPKDEAVMWLIGVFIALCCIHASYLLATAVAVRDQAQNQRGEQQCL